MEPTQAALIDCVYCTRVRPGLGSGCPRCGGVGTCLRPARMMEGAAAREHVLAAWARLEELRREREEAEGPLHAEFTERCREAAIRLLEEVVIYRFGSAERPDLAEGLVEEIRVLEDEARPVT